MTLNISKKQSDVHCILTQKIHCFNRKDSYYD